MKVLAVLLAMAAAWQGTDRTTTVRVYVFTASPYGVERTPEEQGRLDAVDHMRDALARKKGITVVASRAEANVSMEVLDREQREEPLGGFGGKSITRMGDTIIRLRVTAGGEEYDLKGMGQGTWGRAAKDAADKFVRWMARREPSRKTAAQGRQALQGPDDRRQP